MIEQFYLPLWKNPNRVDLGVMEMNEYPNFSKALGMEILYKMQFSIISGTFVVGRGQVGVFYKQSWQGSCN